MRCPDCCKFVSFEQEVEAEADVSGSTVTGTVHVALNCSECGTELKYADLDFEVEVDHDCPKIAEAKAAVPADAAPIAEAAPVEGEAEAPAETAEGAEESDASPTEPEYDDAEAEAEPTDRFETKDRKGKTIKNARYQKHYYGADVTGSVTCVHCHEQIDFTASVEEVASGFEEAC